MVGFLPAPRRRVYDRMCFQFVRKGSGGLEGKWNRQNGIGKRGSKVLGMGQLQVVFLRSALNLHHHTIVGPVVDLLCSLQIEDDAAIGCRLSQYTSPQAHSAGEQG